MGYIVFVFICLLGLQVVLIFVFVEPEVDFSLLSFRINARSHELVELVGECFVEVGRAWGEDGWVGTSGDAAS